VPPQNKIIPLGIILFLLGCTASQLLGSCRESNDGACVSQQAYTASRRLDRSE
jgi:hydrogenase maturation factor